MDSNRVGLNAPELPAGITMRPLRLLLLIDAVFLFLLGCALIFAPSRVQEAFQFLNLPPGVGYMVGLWGCGLVTMAAGYLIAATDPFRHLIWIQIGIARGLLECALGCFYLGRGVITFKQSVLGLLMAAFITVGYTVLYPRKTRPIKVALEQAKSGKSVSPGS